MMARIKDTIIKTLIALEPQMVGTQGTRAASSPSFEIYGFDVLVDQALKPWVLEVNIMPSFSSSSAYDKRVKTMLMCDAFQLVGLQAFNWRHEATAAKKRQEDRRQGRSAPRPKSASRYQAWRANPGELADEDWVMLDRDTFRSSRRLGTITTFSANNITSTLLVVTNISTVQHELV